MTREMRASSLVWISCVAACRGAEPSAATPPSAPPPAPPVVAPAAAPAKLPAPTRIAQLPTPVALDLPEPVTITTDRPGEVEVVANGQALFLQPGEPDRMPGQYDMSRRRRVTTVRDERLPDGRIFVEEWALDGKVSYQVTVFHVPARVYCTGSGATKAAGDELVRLCRTMRVAP
jgi:hypothetical protein